ncbi:hypothetical protein PQX77_018389 [Marasmius sp. AFHP31]|nr:hypothetical protein PQX77_018389 [Marasmius sp. AFHP31]
MLGEIEFRNTPVAVQSRMTFDTVKNPIFEFSTQVQKVREVVGDRSELAVSKESWIREDGWAKFEPEKELDEEMDMERGGAHHVNAKDVKTFFLTILTEERIFTNSQGGNHHTSLPHHEEQIDYLTQTSGYNTHATPSEDILVLIRPPHRRRKRGHWLFMEIGKNVYELAGTSKFLKCMQGIPRSDVELDLLPARSWCIFLEMSLPMLSWVRSSCC